ncbi:MAG TPA: CaiB/BaiF CoA-transferase family protein [Candidatus Limnocylindria bacterium]|nr:CaiB/BaiF CoA-transferase family protein [Candidatus Limnocylindria bacterium]
MGGNLSGIRVLDLTAEPGFMTGMLLGELGADVIKVEPPAGDPARRRPPFRGGRPDPEQALGWLAYNTSKRGITLDLTRPQGRDLFLRLCDTADVVLETDTPGTLAARGLGWDVLHARNPRLILCSLTPFGQTGPYATRRGSDLTVVAMSGNLHCTGDPDRAPLRCTFPVSHYHGSIEAAVGVVFALLAREHGGEGQHVDVACQEAMVMPNIGTASMAAMTGNRGRRAGAFFRQAKSVQREIWPCKDGYVSFALRGGPARVPGLIAMTEYMAEHGMASPKLRAMDWTKYNHNLLSQDEVDELSAEFGAFFLTKTMTELFEAACTRGLMLAPANTPREIVASEQLAARGFFVELDDPVRGRLRVPGAFARTSGPDPDAVAIAVRRPAPRLGEHTAEVLAEIGVDAAALARLRREGVA